MDDILVPGKDLQQEYDGLEQTLQLLRTAGLKLNLKKSHFSKECLECLGYEISQKGIRPGKHKIEAVQNFPIPTNCHEIRQFIRLASYFRKFIVHFASISRPLTDLTR